MKFRETNGHSGRGVLAEASRCTGKASANHGPQGLCTAPGFVVDLIQAAKPWLPSEGSCPCLGLGDPAPSLVWMAGRPASGGRKKSRCPFLGAQVCTYLRWGDLQGRVQGIHHGSPNISKLSLGHCEPSSCWVCERLAGADFLLWAQSMGHPDDQSNTCPLEGAFSEDQETQTVVPRGTSTPDRTPVTPENAL